MECGSADNEADEGAERSIDDRRPLPVRISGPVIMQPVEVTHERWITRKGPDWAREGKRGGLANAKAGTAGR